jgi:hypothetical protein
VSIAREMKTLTAFVPAIAGLRMVLAILAIAAGVFILPGRYAKSKATWLVRQVARFLHDTHMCRNNLQWI